MCHVLVRCEVLEECTKLRGNCLTKLWLMQMHLTGVVCFHVQCNLWLQVGFSVTKVATVSSSCFYAVGLCCSSHVIVKRVRIICINFVSVKGSLFL